ncbi:MAG: acyl-CoA/acyl-ACP dehydrogenase [Desulfobacterales bacterium]|mgnify:FL=1|jgi:3-oxocholest-4-en-26-oyl-CoA dehydrogenase beta subunit|nr:acyl-CoA/acyl-ACP dehydrogenase [Desulfobacteraceae bacterium]MBT7086494.1 acyl-CoA/acyl-ACP dehydrogenase [Desulfobacterales bacterium]MBT7697569.1 acyl-CoA/acyl-ACP dehydrogenase [Desulfobacterales bacterium]
MNFALTKEQKMLQKSIRQYIKKKCPNSLVKELAASEKGYSPELWKEMAELGWMGLVFPDEYEGSNFSFFDLVLFFEEMGYNICPGPLFSTLVLSGLPILNYADNKLKSEILPQISTGEIILTMAVTEENADYIPSSIKTSAIKEGDEYIINGTKLFVNDAHVSDYILCVARTDETPNPEDGVTLFMVNAKTPGVEISLMKNVTLEKPCEVKFENVKVPAKNIIGKLNNGWMIVNDTIEKAALVKSAEMIGGARGTMDLALQYAKERVQFQRPIGSFQAVQQHFANMWLGINGCRDLVYLAASKTAKGEHAEKEIAMAKARTGKIFREVTTLGHQIFGAIGYTMEHDMHLYRRQALSGDITFGNTYSQLDKIAVSLGL